jgi:peptidyl-prolyl cis-trans isomerase C
MNGARRAFIVDRSSFRKDPALKNDVTVALTAVLAVLALCFGVAMVKRNLPPIESHPFVAEATASAPAAKKAVHGKVVMRVNGEPITEEEFNMFLHAAPQQAQAFYATPQGRRAMADELVKLKALEQEAQRQGLADDPEVKTQVDLMTAQITASRALEKLVKSRIDARLQGEYEKQKTSAVMLRHILVAVQGGQVPARNGNPLPPDAAIAKAHALAQRIRGGAKFEDVARAESDDMQSAARGGSIGATPLEGLPPEIASAVSKLKPGEISEPVRTQFGIHIFSVAQPTMEDLRPMLTQAIQREAAEEAVGQLQRSAKVDLDPSFFPPAPQLRTMPMTAPPPSAPAGQNPNG